MPSVSIYARPNTKEPIRRTARQGDLLRVTGVSPGIEGDTQRVVVDDRGLRRPAHASRVDVRVGQGLDAASRGRGAASGWWGAPRSQANVRAAATTKAPVVGTLVPGDRVKVLDEVSGDAVSGNTTWYRIDGGRYAGAVVHSSLVTRDGRAEAGRSSTGQRTRPPGSGRSWCRARLRR